MTNYQLDVISDAVKTIFNFIYLAKSGSRSGIPGGPYGSKRAPGGTPLFRDRSNPELDSISSIEVQHMHGMMRESKKYSRWSFRTKPRIAGTPVPKIDPQKFRTVTSSIPYHVTEKESLRQLTVVLQETQGTQAVQRHQIYDPLVLFSHDNKLSPKNFTRLFSNTLKVKKIIYL